MPTSRTQALEALQYAHRMLSHMNGPTGPIIEAIAALESSAPSAAETVPPRPAPYRPDSYDLEWKTPGERNRDEAKRNAEIAEWDAKYGAAQPAASERKALTDELPPLPDPVKIMPLHGRHYIAPVVAFTREQVEQIQREAFTAGRATIHSTEKGGEVAIPSPIGQHSPDECSADVYEHGESVCTLAVPKEQAEAAVKIASAMTGDKNDWHYIGGRVHVKRLAASQPPVQNAQCAAPADAPKPDGEVATVTLPHPGSPEASAAIDSKLAEYNWPSNPKNAARAGFEAARMLINAKWDAKQ